jgi:signal transduction histidine kinase
MSTNNGLCRFNPIEESLKIYDQTDGLQGDQFFWGAAYKSSKGELFYGGSNGFNRFNPGEIFDDMHKPSIVFTDFKLFNKSVGINDKINDHIILEKSINKTEEIFLTYKENILSLEFSYLHYRVPDENQYKYKLENFDPEYILGNSLQRTVTYTNLAPGKYEFKILASNHDGIWIDSPKILKINIAPPFWQTWWFRILGILFFISILATIYSLRVAQIKRNSKKLKVLVTEKTHELDEKNKQLERQKDELYNKNEILSKQTSDLNDINAQLEERQQRVEEQSEELRVQAEVLRDTNQILVETNASKDKFFNIIAHDLKNPLNSILGLTELFSMRFEKIDTEKKLKYASEIYNAAKKSYELLENLLEWSRSQTNRIKTEPSVISVNSIIDQNLQLLAQNIQDKSIEIQNNLMPNSVAYADYNMCNTVFRNLISNAIKFTPKGGKISLASKITGSEIKITVSDTGVGIAKEKLENLFKIDKNTTTKGTDGEMGTGLGLILCNEFVIKNNGELTVDSILGKGTTIEVKLPHNK